MGRLSVVSFDVHDAFTLRIDNFSITNSKWLILILSVMFVVPFLWRVMCSVAPVSAIQRHLSSKIRSVCLFGTFTEFSLRMTIAFDVPMFMEMVIPPVPFFSSSSDVILDLRRLLLSLFA